MSFPEILLCQAQKFENIRLDEFSRNRSGSRVMARKTEIRKTFARDFQNFPIKVKNHIECRSRAEIPFTVFTV